MPHKYILLTIENIVPFYFFVTYIILSFNMSLYFVEFFNDYNKNIIGEKMIIGLYFFNIYY